MKRWAKIFWAGVRCWAYLLCHCLFTFEIEMRAYDARGRLILICCGRGTLAEFQPTRIFYAE